LKKHFSEKRALFEKSDHFRDFVAFFNQIIACFLNILSKTLHRVAKSYRSARFFSKVLAFFQKCSLFSKVLAFSKCTLDIDQHIDDHVGPFFSRYWNILDVVCPL